MASLVSRHTPLAVVATATCLAGSPPSAALAHDLFTPQHVAKIRTVTSAAISPDGTSIAYTVSVPRRPLVDDDGGPWNELHIVGPYGVARPLVTGENILSSVQFTPDGKGLSFLARRGKDTTHALYVLPLAGGEARRVLGQETGVGSYTWSPDGKRVAFLAAETAPKARRELEKKGFTQGVYEGGRRGGPPAARPTPPARASTPPSTRPDRRLSPERPSPDSASRSAVESSTREPVAGHPAHS